MSVKLEGIIIRLSDKTATVEVSRIKRHPLYKKQYRLTKKFLVHNPDNHGAKGDSVEITEIAPVSRKKRWQLGKILESK